MKDRLGIIKGCLISILFMCLFMVQQGYAIPTASETTNQADLTYDPEVRDRQLENRQKKTRKPDLEVTTDETLVKLASLVDNTLDQLANRYDSMLTDLATKWNIENFDHATQWKNDAKLDVKIKNLAARLNKTLEYQSISGETLVTAELIEKWYNEGTENMNNSLIEISKYEIIEKDLKPLMSSNNQVMRHRLSTKLDKKMDSFEREIVLPFRELHYDPKWFEEKWIQLGDKFVKHIDKLANRYDNRLTVLANQWKIEDVELANNTKKEDVDLGKRVKIVAVRLNTALEHQATLMERLVTDELANKWRDEDAALDQIWDYETTMLKTEAKKLAGQMNMTYTNMINGLKMTIPVPSTSFNQSNRDDWQRFVADSDAFIETVLVPFCTLMPEAVTSNKEVQPSQLERMCHSFNLFDKIIYEKAKLTDECNELTNAWSYPITDQIRRTRHLILTELYRKFDDKAAHLNELKNESLKLAWTWKDDDDEFVIKLKNLETRLNITLEENRGENLATDIEEQIMTYVRQALAPLKEHKALNSNQEGHTPPPEQRHRRDTEESGVELPFEEKLKNFPITTAKTAAATKIAVASKIPLAVSLPLGAMEWNDELQEKVIAFERDVILPLHAEKSINKGYTSQPEQRQRRDTNESGVELPFEEKLKNFFADKLAGLAKKLSRAKEKFSKDIIHDEINQAVTVMTEKIEDEIRTQVQGYTSQPDQRHRRDTDESGVELPFEEKLKNFPITAAKTAAATKIALASKIPLAASLPLGAIGIFADKLAGLAKKLSRAKEKFSKDMIHDEIDQAVSVMTEKIEDDNVVKALSTKEKLKAAATMIGSAKLGLASKLPSLAATGLSAVGQIFEKLSVGASKFASAKVDFANDILFREAERLKRISEDLKTLLTPEEYDEGEYSEWFDDKDDFQM